MRKHAGFTLIELMVVVTIIAILASVAYVLYGNQVMKSRRTEARVVLNEIALAQERFFTINGRYASSAELGAVYTDALSKMTDRDGVPGPDFYSVAVVDSTTSYTISAAAAGVQLKDVKCASFAVDQLGVKTATGTDTDQCW